MWLSSGGETVKDTAARFGVARQTVHAWLAKYEAGGIENLGDAHRPGGRSGWCATATNCYARRPATTHGRYARRSHPFPAANADLNFRMGVIGGEG